jgi:hypothetical protein
VSQDQNCLARASDLIFVADFWQLEEWIVESIHVEAVAADQHLDMHDRSEKGDILDRTIKDIGFP